MADDVSRLSVDVEQVNSLLHSLRITSPEFTKAVKSGLRRSLSVLRTSVRQGAASVTSNKDKQKKGVSYKVYRNASGGQVNIYTPFYTESNGRRRVFIMRWLEEGTKAGPIKRGRRRKDGGNRMHGATPAKPFFNASVLKARPQAESILSDNIIKYINVVASKRKV